MEHSRIEDRIGTLEIGSLPIIADGALEAACIGTGPTAAPCPPPHSAFRMCIQDDRTS